MLHYVQKNRSHFFLILISLLNADDTVNFSFHPRNLDSIIVHLQNALQWISSWKSANIFSLNFFKAEYFSFLIIGRKSNNITLHQ